MILSEHEIRDYLASGKLVIEPPPDDSRIDTTTIDLRIGRPLRQWNPKIASLPGFQAGINIDQFKYHEVADQLMVDVPIENDGTYKIAGETFYIGQTEEKIFLPVASKLAARVEGRSSLARLGLVIHMTAPTIQCGYGPGIITLEIFNYGPWPLFVTPGRTLICQLIIECVLSEPTDRKTKQKTFQATDTAK